MFNGRIYTVKWDAATAITAQIDIFELIPAANKPIYVHELKLWQTTELGDAAEEILGISFIRGFATSGSTGGTPTVAKKYSGDAAASFTAECRNTGLAVVGAGTTEHIQADGWNVRVPYIWTPTPEDRPFCSAADTRLVIRIDAAPADSITMNAAVVVEEIG